MVSARVEALRKRAEEARNVLTWVIRDGEWIQVHISAQGADRWLRLTQSEAALLHAQIGEALGGGA